MGITPAKSAVSDGSLFLIVDKWSFIAPRDPTTGNKSIFTVPGPRGPVPTPRPGLGAINLTGGRGQFRVTFSGRNVGVVVMSSDHGATRDGAAIVPGKGAASLLGTVSMTKK